MPTKSYASALEMRGWMDKTTTEDISDPELQRFLDAAARSINRASNRPDGFVADVAASVRTYRGSGKTYQWIDECVEITAVAVKESVTDDAYTAWATGDWIPFSGDPAYPDFNRLPYWGLVIDPTGDQSIFISGEYVITPGFRPTTSVGRGAPTVQVTAKWGYAEEVPDDIKTACIMQAIRWYKRLQGAMADTVAGPDFGTMLFRQALDPDIKKLLVDGRYTKPALGRW
jgi:hypothetical protein